MDTAQLGVSHGEWLEVNCGKMPSEKNCKLVIMAPSDQEDDLLDAAVAHAIKTHGHTESEAKDLRKGTRDNIEVLAL
jgi:predicted small metal-binding protein